jgi:hypothetical protein
VSCGVCGPTNISAVPAVNMPRLRGSIALTRQYTTPSGSVDITV